MIAYMMKAKKLSLADALKLVKEKRRIVKPNTGFATQLKEWERILQDDKFVADATFVRNPVSKLREKHESKSRTAAGATPSPEKHKTKIPDSEGTPSATPEPTLEEVVVQVQAGADGDALEQSGGILISRNTMQEQNDFGQDSVANDKTFTAEEQFDVVVVPTMRFSVLDVATVA